MTGPVSGSAPGAWFEDHDGERGLRFECTMCGNCCTGPPGYVLVTDDEVRALALRMGVSVEVFLRDYTNVGPEGRSLNEVSSRWGYDCVFLDRTTIPGKAVCGVYEDRPVQCRTWPFWPDVIESRKTWSRAKRTCPGVDRGTLIPPEQIRVLRDETPGARRAD